MFAQRCEAIVKTAAQASNENYWNGYLMDDDMENFGGIDKILRNVGYSAQFIDEISAYHKKVLSRNYIVAGQVDILDAFY